MKVFLRGIFGTLVIAGVLVLGSWILRYSDAAWHRQMMMLMLNEALAGSGGVHTQRQLQKPGSSDQMHMFACDKAIVDYVAAKPFWIVLDAGEAQMLKMAKSDLSSHTARD